MPGRFEEEFARVEIPLPPRLDPTDPTGALRRRGEALRAEATRAALVWLGRRVGRHVARLLRWRRPGRAPGRCPELGCG